MFFGQTFSNISKGTAKKAGPSFFDSSYHLRNYTQLVVGPELFTSNTSKNGPFNGTYNRNQNQSNSQGHFPNYSNGLYSYYSTLALDPYTSSLAYHHFNNNNNNNCPASANRNIAASSLNPYANIDEEFIAANNRSSRNASANLHMMAPPTGAVAAGSAVALGFDHNNNNNHNHNHNNLLLDSTKDNNILYHTTLPQEPSSSLQKHQPKLSTQAGSPSNLLKLAIGGKRSYATVVANSTTAPEHFLKKNRVAEQKINDDEIHKSSIINKFVPHRPGYNVQLKARHLHQLKHAMDEVLENQQARNMLSGMKDCIAKENIVEVYPFYQALRRNELPISVPVFNIVLYCAANREVSGGESIEEKLTTVLTIYSDMVSQKLCPNNETYDIVLGCLFNGAFDSYKLYLDRQSTESSLDDDGAISVKKVDSGENYFKLGMEIFLAANYKTFQALSQPVYESLLVGLAMFGYKMKDSVTLKKLLNVLSKSNFEKNKLYYMSLIKYGCDVAVIENNTREEVSNRELGYKFMLNVYNEYKGRSVNEPALLKAQYDIYAVLMYSLCELNQFFTATKILDDLLISMRSGNHKLSQKNQTGGLNKVVMIYLIGLVANNKADRSRELYSKFEKAGVVYKNELSDQYFINLLINNCHSGDLPAAQELFQEHIMKIIDKSTLHYEQQHPISTKEGKSQLLFDSLIKSSMGVGQLANSISKAVGSYLTLNLHLNNTKEILQFINFDENHLSKTSKTLLTHLDEDGAYHIVQYLVNHNFPALRVMRVLDHLAHHKDETFDVNHLLGKLCNDVKFVEWCNNGDNCDILLQSSFLHRCDVEFSVKKYVAECERSNNINYNKYFGIMVVWFAYWRKAALITKESGQLPVINNELSFLAEEFDNLDNYYLQKNIDQELAAKVGTIQATGQPMSVEEEGFYSQLNAMVEFKNHVLGGQGRLMQA
ncbi:ribonuclease P [Saccharomycopsis crataegensis]|uniref:Ribonuclease P n=1 Tax=Saccharomycopsis crataegensis TaxID=43959 RepID=A0AAV5QTU4_9ASCO|nr:ribonuclease P [Saccharomycopsis crataegensis]